MKKHWIASLIIAGSLTFAHATAQDKPVREIVNTFQEKIKANDLDGAIQILDEATEDKVAFPPFLRQQLAMNLLQRNRNEDAVKQVTTLLETTYEEIARDGNAIPFASSFPIANNVLRRANQNDKAQEWLEKGLTAVQAKLDPSKLTALHGAYGQLIRAKANWLTENGNAEAGNALLSEYIVSAEKLLESDPKDEKAITTIFSLWNLVIGTQSPEEANRTFAKAQSLAQSSLKESVTIGLLQSYLASVSNYASIASRTDPDAAESAITSARDFVKTLSLEDSNLERLVSDSGKGWDRTLKSIESSRALLAMVGQPAPDLDPLQWVNGEPETLDSLKGKVVLLDFWAVWCGPCIATFPHLKHLDQEYGPKGLALIGVTRQYNFAWDDDKQSAARSPEPVSLEDELAMLKKFINKNELTHRTFLTPEKSDMQSNYHVTGIPHAVVIDKKGIVRLVKVGSGEKNAKEIEETIQKLLDE